VTATVTLRKVGQKTRLQYVCFGFFIVNSDKNSSLLLHMDPRLSCGTICSFPPLISVCVLCCQPSCHNCVHLAIVF